MHKICLMCLEPIMGYYQEYKPYEYYHDNCYFEYVNKRIQKGYKLPIQLKKIEFNDANLWQKNIDNEIEILNKLKTK